MASMRDAFIQSLIQKPISVKDMRDAVLGICEQDLVTLPGELAEAALIEVKDEVVR